MTRTRKHLIALAFALLSLSVAGKSFAGEDSGDKGGGGSEDHGSGGDDHGGGGDDDSGDDDGGGNNSGPTNGGTQSGTNNGQSTTQNQARDIIRSGKAVSLPLVLAYMSSNYRAQVLDVKLRSSIFGYYYDVKYLDTSNHLLSVALDAKTLQKR